MKIPLQDKIAEHERRIEALEEAERKRTAKMPQAFDSETRYHWNRMWAEFDLVMRRVFRR